jgi:hypothetical protein
LNGRGFSVAPLQPGDRLYVGRVEFEMLDERTPRQSQDEAGVSDGERAGQESDAARSSVVELREQLDIAQTALASDRSQWESDRGHLQSRLNEQTRELDRLRSELATNLSELEESQQQAVAHSDQLAGANQQLQDAQKQLSQVKRQLAEQSEQLVEARAEAHPDQEALIQELREALATLEQQFDSQTEETGQLRDQLQASESKCQEVERTLVSTQQQLAEASQFTERFEQVTAELETARGDLETRTQQWEQKLAERTAAVQDLRKQLEQAGRLHARDVAERQNVSSRITQLEEENSRLNTELAELQQQSATSELGPKETSGGFSELQETVTGLEAELKRTRAEHQQAVAEWQSDRSNLENQLAEKDDKLLQLQQQHDTSMREAEELITSLQHEGKELLSQLQEAKYAIRHDTEMRKQIEAELARSESGETDELRKEVQSLEERGGQEEHEIGSPTMLLTSQVDMSTVAADDSELNKRDDMVTPGDAGIQDRPAADSSMGEQPSGTVVLDAEFKPELPDVYTEIVDRLRAGERPTEDQQPSPECTQPAAVRDDQVSIAAIADEDTAANDDEALIQNYMERLLQRVGGRTQEAGHTEARVEASASAETAETNDMDGLSEHNDLEVEPQPSTTETRSIRPEKSEDLLAMRELANRSARMAICSSDQRRVFMSAVGEFGVAAVSLAISSTVVLMSPEWVSVYSIGGYFGLAFGCVWGLYGLRSLFSARALCKSNDDD